MPIVCYHDDPDDTYIIVDGFHRYRIMLDYPDIYERENGMLPVSVINKPLDHRMASTIRHNRARGSHSVDLMSNIIKELHDLGRSDAWISKHLGMERDEILRLKQITDLPRCFGIFRLAMHGFPSTKKKTRRHPFQKMRSNKIDQIKMPICQ